jgi:hypothetical protein
MLFKNAVHIVLTEVLQADGTLTREWYGEITANDPLVCAQSITDSLGYEIDVCANGQPVSLNRDSYRPWANALS